MNGVTVKWSACSTNTPSSNPAKVYNFYVEIVVEKIENKEKVAGIGTFLKNN